MSLIHVWYRPDSYDSWLPAKDFADPEPEPPAKDGQPWLVATRWLRDSMRYNELMNEEDYEKEDEDGAQSGAAAAEESNMAATTQSSTTTTTSVSGTRSRKRGLPEDVAADDDVAVEDEDGNATSNASTGKRIKLLVAAKPVGAVAIDLTGASGPPPGRNYEKEAISGGQLGNLPPEGEPSRGIEDGPKVEGQSSSTSTVPEVRVAGTSGDVTMTDEPSAAEVAAAQQAAEEAERLATEAVAKKYLAEQTQEVIIPSYSTWFTFSGINPVEKRSLPEFFNNRNRSKTPAIYKDYRNFMINVYRLNPSEYLTFTACRRNLAGDVCAIMRVHAFLEQWGLINYQVDPETRPASLGPPFTGHFRVTVDTPRGLQPLHPGTQRPSQPGMPPHPLTPMANGKSHQQQQQPASAKPSTDLTLELRRTIYQTSMKLSRPIDTDTAKSLAEAAETELRAGAGAGPSHSCDTCGSDCTRTRYTSIRAPARGAYSGGYTLCPGCYLEGRFPSSMYSGDFVRIDDGPFKQGSDESNDEWSDAETLRLLEGLEMYEDDWGQVSTHVGTRSREQCITRFLQLPIEDPFLDGTDNASKRGAAETTTNGQGGGSRVPTQGDLGPLQYLRDFQSSIPFAQTDNPVMSVVAFLASAVSPAVASAAAQSALGELTQGIKRREELREKKRAEEKEGGDKEQSKDQDAMDVDKEGEAQVASIEEKPSEGETDKSKDPNRAKITADADITVNVSDSVKAQIRESREDEGLDNAAESDETIPHNAVERAAAVALGAAAAKAHLLATFEERECQRLVGQVIEAQMKKMEIKMAQFEELESLLEEERRSLESGRKQLYQDRLAVQRQIAAVHDLMRKASTQPQSVTHRDVASVNSAVQGLHQQGPVVRQVSDAEAAATHQPPPAPQQPPATAQPADQAAAPAAAAATAPTTAPQPNLQSL